MGVWVGTGTATSTVCAASDGTGRGASIQSDTAGVAAIATPAIALPALPPAAVSAVLDTARSSGFHGKKNKCSTCGQGPSRWHSSNCSGVSGRRNVKPLDVQRVAEKSAAVAKAAVQGFASAFVGVSWHKQAERWLAYIRHSGMQHSLGYFHDEQEAARAYDTAARRLRPKGQAHGGPNSGGGGHWQRVNFPTTAEKEFATEKGMPA